MTAYFITFFITFFVLECHIKYVMTNQEAQKPALECLKNP